jgi:hypothetical protein
MVFNATFNISRLPVVLLVDETVVPRENHRFASNLLNRK